MSECVNESLTGFLAGWAGLTTIFLLSSEDFFAGGAYARAGSYRLGSGTPDRERLERGEGEVTHQSLVLTQLAAALVASRGQVWLPVAHHPSPLPRDQPACCDGEWCD